ncbi:MAG: AAA family ATPase, partial [Proteobacteria bacterium]|nr:AAA family ATPase [Pseudomonadota bacterium]
MKCDQCQFDNPDNMSFCGQCGARLERVCPGCGLANPPEFKFCGGCGHDLTAPVVKELSPDEKLARIQRYLPQNLTEKILAQRGRIEGEKREVTVMFCDMAGYTTLAESLGPERTFQVMDRVYETLIHQVHDFGGTVNELTGDGIMALFGAPIALEDAPQRALRAALAVHRALDALGLEDGADGQERPDLRMRIGVHSGPVVVGTLGNDLRVEFKAVGDTVNLASRMEGLAEPGTTYVTGATFKLTEGFFEFEPLGQRPVKGRVEPVSVFRLIGPTATRTRFDVSAERGLTALVGREREIELLRDGLDRALSGRGQAFSIVAEAGLGKSRLLHEFRQTLAGQDVTFLEGKCLSYSRGVAFHPHVDLLRSNFRLRDGETDAQVRDKVQKGLAVLGADDEATRPYILELMSARDSGVDQSRLSPEAIKDRMIEAMKRIVLTGSELRPLVLAYEDLHWADKTSAEVFGHLIETIPGARVMVIFTYRPEFTPAWGVKSYHHQITLNRLTRRETLTMVSRLLGTDGVAPDLEDLILDKSEGIPFFIEEYLRSLRELNIIARDDDQYRLAGGHGAVTIPSTIQDVILARVDTLDEGTKEVLQNASAIEREFGYELLRRVTGLAERELRSRLAVLKDAELVYERGLGAEASFLFKHALTQEAVYGSLLTAKRKELHQR